MSIWKKALSVGTSAALLASLFTALVAAPVAASVTVTSVGSIPVGGTSSGTLTMLFTEREAAGPTCPTPGVNGLNNVAGSLTITIDGPTLDQVSFDGTPVVSAPDSLKATASASGKVLTVSWTNSDCANIETIQITGLKIKAVALATPGPVTAKIGPYPAVDPTGDDWRAFFNFTGTTTASASGTILASDELLAGADTANILLASVCPFAPTVGLTSQASFSDASDPRNVTAGPLPVNGVQSVGFAAGTLAHNAGVTVTQTVDYQVCAAALGGAPLPGSVGTIGNAVKVSTNSTKTVFPGENNSPAGDLRALEPVAGFLPKDATLTWTIATDGIVFSKAPDVFKAGDIGVGAATLSADRKTAVVKVTAASVAACAPGACSQVWLINVLYDVAATVPGGTFVKVNLTLSSGLLVTGNPVENAIVFRGITASAPTPTVYIGENNQATGLVTLVEGAAGFFQSGTGSNNVLTVCPLAAKYSFTVAPWAKVTAGDLKLREGNVVSPDNIVEGTATTSPRSGCFNWTVWTKSTVASTIVIGNSTFATGPPINVTVDQAPGTVALDVYSGDGGTFSSLIASVGFANATYRNQVAVTALSQPKIASGATNAPAGDIQIAETGFGQLKNNSEICVEVLWRSGEAQDQFLNMLATADLPIATPSGGVVISPVNPSQSTCTPPTNGGAPMIPAQYMRSFSFRVLQQSTAGTGKVVISNIKLTTLTDSAEGPVQLSVWGKGVEPTTVNFHATVSNAIIGAKTVLSIGSVSALGLNPTSGYTTKTPKVQVPNKYVTWKFTGGKTLANQRVNILVALRINGAWGGPQYLVSRTADANGIVTFYWKAPAGTVLNIRAQWPGNATYSVSTSRALGVHWK